MNNLEAKPYNPYTYGRPVQGILFFGRERELAEITHAVTKPAKQDIFIAGARRTGKTSLLYELKRRLDKPFIPIYVALYEAEPKTESVLELILRKIITQLRQWNILDPNFQKGINFSPAYFEDNIAEIILAAKKQQENAKIVLLLDEADFLLAVDSTSSESTNTSWLRRFFSRTNESFIVDTRLQNILRATIQSNRIGDDLRIVMAGTDRLSFSISDYASPLLNIFMFVHLDPLTPKDTYELIVKPASVLGYTYSLDAIERIIGLSGGQPFYCQALCYETFNHALQYEHHNIDTEDISFAEKMVVEGLFETYLAQFWRRANKEERHFLLALAQGKSLRSISKAELRRLLDWQIIKESQGIYSFSAGLCEIWTEMLSKKG